MRRWSTSVEAKGSPMVQETRLTKEKRASLTRGTLALLCFTAALTACGYRFGRSLLDSYYISRDGKTGIVMVHLVEAPRGHLTGAAVITTLNQSSSTPNTRHIWLRGSIAGSNVTLKTPGLFGFFSTQLIGTLAGDRLTLSRPGQANFTLYSTSARGYQERLASLNRIQTHLNTVRDAQHLVKSTLAYVKQINAALAQYQSWGRDRIAHQADVHEYWIRKVKFYDACLARIRPLAAAGVPEWQWQECAITVSNDAYFREQAVAVIEGLQRVAREKSAAIAQMLTEAPVKVEAAVRALRAACPYTSDPKFCENGWRRWHAAETSLVPPARLAAFRALRQKIRQAIGNDAQTAETSNASLQVTATEIIRIYDAPQNYRRT